MSFLTGNVVTQCECIPLCKAKGTEQNHRIECTEVLSPLACRILDILLVTVTDETGNYAQVLSAVLSASTHIHKLQLLQNAQTHTFPLIAIRRLALSLIMTLIHYERELKPGLCCCPNSNQAVNEAEKMGMNLRVKRLFRHVNSNTCTLKTHCVILLKLLRTREYVSMLFCNLQ